MGKVFAVKIELIKKPICQVYPTLKGPKPPREKNKQTKTRVTYSISKRVLT